MSTNCSKLRIRDDLGGLGVPVDNAHAFLLAQDTGWNHGGAEEQAGRGEASRCDLALVWPMCANQD